MTALRIASVGALAALALTSVKEQLIDIYRRDRSAPSLEGLWRPTTWRRSRYRDTSSPYRCARSRARRRMERETKQRQRRMGGR